MIENYRLIYPNSETEQYEAYMRTAKIVWEEFTGSAKIEPKMSVKKEKHTVAAVQPIEFNGNVKNNQLIDADEVKETKIANKNNEIKEIGEPIIKVRKRPVSAVQYNAQRLCKLISLNDIINIIYSQIYTIQSNFE